jgi:hypothetical protein
MFVHPIIFGHKIRKKLLAALEILEQNFLNRLGKGFWRINVDLD